MVAVPVLQRVRKPCKELQNKITLSSKNWWWKWLASTPSPEIQYHTLPIQVREANHAGPSQLLWGLLGCKHVFHQQGQRIPVLSIWEFLLHSQQPEFEIIRFQLGFSESRYSPCSDGWSSRDHDCWGSWSNKFWGSDFNSLFNISSRKSFYFSNMKSTVFPVDLLHLCLMSWEERLLMQAKDGRIAVTLNNLSIEFLLIMLLLIGSPS